MKNLGFSIKQAEKEYDNNLYKQAIKTLYVFVCDNCNNTNYTRINEEDKTVCCTECCTTNKINKKKLD